MYQVTGYLALCLSTLDTLSYSRRVGFVVNYQRGEIIRFGEEPVDVLQLQALGLRIEEINGGNPTGIEHGKDNIRPPANILDGCCTGRSK